MQRSPVFRFAVLWLAWMALAVWQWRDYDAECRHARETLVRQAESIVQALTGGIRSHRRLGYFFADQLEGVLEELVETQDVLAAAVASADGRLVCSAGVEGERPPAMPSDSETAWRDGALLYVRRFELPPRSDEPLGHGRGLGRGRGPRRMLEPGGDETAPFAEGGAFTASLVLDASSVADRCYRAAWTRIAVVAAGALVLLFLAAVWRSTFRLAEARAREQLLETEARHLRELGQAAAGLAHETRNPLGLIRGWTQRLASPDSDVEAPAERAQAVMEECDRLTARINQFLAFARPPEPRPETVRLADVAAELTALLEPDLQGKGVRLDSASLAQGLAVRADRELLRQVLFNLVRNAIEFAPEGSTVEIRQLNGHDGRSCRLEVADLGPGVPPELAGKLFTPYFTTRKEGTGLGLAIVRRIALSHGWQAGYRPQAGGGAVFWVDGIQGSSVSGGARG